MTTAEAGMAARIELRDWVQQRLGLGHEVRTECWLTGLSAATHRLIKFGVEDGFKQYSARELVHFQLLLAGELADDLLRSTFTRAIVEGDGELAERLAVMPQVADLMQWVRALDDAADAGQAAAALAALTPGEELATARLVLGRRFPSLLDAGWLDDAGDLPVIAHHLAVTMAHARPDLAAPVLAFLARHPEVLVAGESDALLAPLVRHGAAAPQAAMSSFSGYYGDETLMAAAEWHLEHGQPAAALELAERLGRFSRLRHQARLIAGIALADLGRVSDAIARGVALIGTDQADVLTLHLASREAGDVPNATLAAIMDRCAVDQPERFFAALRCLLARKDLAAARAACQRRRGDFAGHPQLGPMIAAVVGPA